MPGKKKGGKKKGGGKKKSSKEPVAEITFDYQPPLVSELGLKEVSYISLTIKMVEMVHLSFDWEVVPTLVTLAGIKDSIRTRHGGTLLGIILYKELVSEQNLLPDDDALSLQDVGIEGGIYTGIAEQLPHITLWYDTPPLEVDCPVLNDTPYEYVPKYLSSSFSPRKTSPQKLLARKTNEGSPDRKGAQTSTAQARGGVGGSLLKRLGTPATPAHAPGDEAGEGANLETVTKNLAANF